MTLNSIGKNPNKPMISLNDENGSKVWYFVAQKAVYDFVKENIQPGDKVEIATGPQKRDALQVLISIKKVGGVNPPVSAPTTEGKKCSECGYALKDDKYDKCYLCNKKAKEAGEQSAKTPTDAPKFTCSECGTELKDGKYKKCYNCNQKAKNDEEVKNVTSDSPKCIDCGKVLKDSKYTKCYVCNQKNPEKTTQKSSTSESIEKQNANKCTSNALIGLQGRYGLNEVCDIIDMLWDKFYEKLKK